MDYAVPRTGGDARPAIDDGQALGGKGTGIAAPQTLINAILDVLASLSIDHIDISATPIACSARSSARG
jgi:hypothetical protein